MFFSHKLSALTNLWSICFISTNSLPESVYLIYYSYHSSYIDHSSISPSLFTPHLRLLYLFIVQHICQKSKIKSQQSCLMCKFISLMLTYLSLSPFSSFVILTCNHFSKFLLIIHFPLLTYLHLNIRIILIAISIPLTLLYLNQM